MDLYQLYHYPPIMFVWKHMIFILQNILFFIFLVLRQKAVYEWNSSRRPVFL